MEVEKLAIAKLELKAGDVLVVQLNRRQPTEVMNRVRDSIYPHLPTDVKIMVIAPSINLAVLTAADVAGRTS
ncbi:hypothetical protein MA20_12885 [Bradyrhizobium japonicum]|uniref:Uncharacterized protein n=1 Tax=Bradyrhizobium japonicum TaxID=375 RepID=A0A0A3XY38_BRAJP|nr:hypothetical protein [Bradyrhizobium japonicum]KGT79305.1 hypothetical protein MA20_12885 [Bradyrhizobium japonicum]